jgi:polar amino acid transport system substrate-binding protein
MNIRLLLLTLILVASSALVPFSSFAQGEKTLRWAADAESGAPFVFQDPKNLDQLMGFEFEIITAIAEKLGRKPVFVQNAWDGLIPGLQRDQYDVVINGVEITEDRKAEILFSTPYFITYEQLVVRRDNESIKDLITAGGHAVGTLKLSVAERILKEQKNIEVRSYEEETNAFADLKQGRTDGVLLDAPIAQYYAQSDPALKLVGPPTGNLLYGIGIRKDAAGLKREIDQALDALVKSGQLRVIFERWALWNSLMADHWKDHASSNVEPVQYQYFLSQQVRERTWRDRANLYISLLPTLGKAALTTLEISLAAMVIAIALGLLLALIRLYAPRPFSLLAVMYIEFVRGTPLLIQLFFIYYALPHLGIQLSPWVAAITGLGLNYAACEAENYRAGIQSIPKGQSEAAFALGLTNLQAIRHVVLPQAVRIVIPPITNDFIALLKDSSLVSIITMVELTKTYGQLASTYYDYIGIGILVALFYLLLGLPFVRLSRWLEKRLHVLTPKVRSKDGAAAKNLAAGPRTC